MTKTMQLDIVSAEQLLYSGEVSAVFVTGGDGELGIYPGHLQLLSSIKPGQIRFIHPETHEEDVFYVSGGFIEVQPKLVTVLADTAIRAQDIDETAAMEAKKRAEQILTEKKSNFEYAKAQAELGEAVAQIRALRKLRERSTRK
jgi:F-type H+-transporting ATPase subunit epsilon